jgi:hypothetical protein
MTTIDNGADTPKSTVNCPFLYPNVIGNADHLDRLRVRLYALG